MNEARSGREFADLNRLVAPRSIAIVGASEKGLGGNVTRNLLTHSTFDGKVHLVSARSTVVFGRPTVSSLGDLDADVDVVLVVVPREHVPDVLRQAERKGADFAVVMTAGFAEAGDDLGRELDREIAEVLASGSLRLVGPNCPGLGDLARPLGLTLQPGFADEVGPGSIGLVAQSGGLSRCILQAMHRGAAFSYFFSPGNQADLDIADYTNFLVDDPSTEVIALAVEHFPSGNRFARVAERARAAQKPIVLLKTGTSDAGREAASSHTGAIVGSKEALEAMCRRLGIALVDDVNHLVNVAAHLRRKVRPAAQTAAVFGMSGGAAVVVTDALARQGVPLSELEEDTCAKLRAVLPAGVPLSNPLDLAAASFVPGAFKEALRITAAAAEVGVVVVLLNAWYAGLTRLFVDACLEVAADTETAVVPVWMSSREGPELDDLEGAGLFPCRSAGEAAVVARALVSRVENRVPADEPMVEFPETGRLPSGVLLEDAGKELLRNVGITVTRETVVRDAAAAAAAARALGFPIIAKVVDPGATHRAGTGLVSGALRNDQHVGEAWSDLMTAAARHLPDVDRPAVLVAEFVEGELEAYIGLIRDPEWDAMISFGMGGRWIEELRDVTLLPLPATNHEVLDALDRSKLGRAMDRLRLPDDVRRQFADAVTRIGALAVARPEIAELDVNPVIVAPTRVVAVDALFRVN